MDALSILAIAMQCSTAAPAPVVAALAMTETQGGAFTVTVDGDRSDHDSLDMAVQSVALALVYEGRIKIGIAGVPVEAFGARDQSYVDGFSACQNMAVAGDELRERVEAFGGQEEHWRLAVLDYGTGEPGVDGDYAVRFDEAFAQIEEVAGQLGGQSVAQANRSLDAAHEPSPASARNYAEPSETSSDRWDVYGRVESRSLLIFSQ